MPIQLKFNNTDLQDIFSSRTGNNSHGSKYSTATTLDVGSSQTNWNNSHTRASNVNFKMDNGTDFAAIFYPVYYDVTSTSTSTVTMPSWASKVAFVVQSKGGTGDGGFTDYWMIITIPVVRQVVAVDPVQFSDKNSARWQNQLNYRYDINWTNQNNVAWHNDVPKSDRNLSTTFFTKGYTYQLSKYWRDRNFYRNNNPQTWKQSWQSGFKSVTTFDTMTVAQLNYGRFHYTTPLDGLNYGRSNGLNYAKNYGRGYGQNYGRTYQHFYQTFYNTNYTRSQQYSQAYCGSAGGGGGCIGGVYNIQTRSSTITISCNFNNNYSNIIFNDTSNSVTAYNGNNATVNANSAIKRYAYPGSQNTSTDTAGGGGTASHNGANFVNIVTSSGSTGQTTSNNGAASTNGGGSGIANNSTIQTNFLPTFDTNYGRGGNGTQGAGVAGSNAFIRYWFIK